MLKFYNKVLILIIALLGISAVLAYFCIRASYLNGVLLPAHGGKLRWHLQVYADGGEADSSEIRVKDASKALAFDFKLSRTLPTPFVAAELFFDDEKRRPVHVDLSKYTSLSFSVECTPDNTMMVGVTTFEDKVSKIGDFLTYRTPSSYFYCSNEKSRVEVDLTRLETPVWWFDMFKLNVSGQKYKLDRVPKISFGNSFQSPKGVLSSVKISDIVLNGRDFRYLKILAGLLLLIWCGFLMWFIRSYQKALVLHIGTKLDEDRPLLAYRQLALEPHKDKEKSTLLNYISTHYTDPELSLESVAAATAINRTKVNDILKAELGYTFSTYLNKVRLAEAARLLSEKETASVGEIAYAVGYNNASYFNKLFKAEYGCTPKAFRKAS